MQTLFKNDDIIVKGRFYNVDMSIEREKEEIKCLELDFTIRVNGKLCNFTDSFILEKDEEDGRLFVEQVSTWFTILRILESMGYTFEENPNGFCLIWKNILKDWIGKINDDSSEG